MTILGEALSYIYFIYGLAFFISGYTILFQTIKIEQKTSYIQGIKYLGLFFLIHSLADWAPLFSDEQSKLFGDLGVMLLEYARIVVMAVAFYFLLLYAVKLLSQRIDNRLLSFLPGFFILLWLFSTVYTYFIGNWELTYPAAKYTVRMLIGFPASLITAYALWNETKHIDNAPKSTLIYLKLMYIAFTIFAISLLFSSRAPFFPANVINGTLFFQTFKVPIQLVRAACAILISYSMVVILNMINKDFIDDYEAARRQSAIYEERERISQDIHDGTLQSLFAIGLRADLIVKQLKKENYNTAIENLNVLKEKIDETSLDIRKYILGLRTNTRNEEFITRVNTIIDDFMLESKILVNFDFDRAHNYKIDDKIANQLAYVIKEALSNIRKHSHATKVNILIVIYGSNLELIIRDNGQGLENLKTKADGKTAKQLGLDSMRKRVNDLKGSFVINSKKELGTEIYIKIPLI